MIRSIGIAAALAVMIAGSGPARAEPIRGVVLAEDGKPAAGASVWAVRADGNGPPERWMGVADAAGRFAFEFDQGNWGLGAGLGDQGPEFALTYVHARATAIEPITIQLKAQGRLRVRLVEAETARPIVGARFALDNGLEPVADADGRLEVRGLARSNHRQGSAWAPGRECQLVHFVMDDGPTTDLEIALPRGGRAVGRVLDAAGNPIAGATVGPNGWGGVNVIAGHLNVRTDVQGRFEFDGLPVDQVSSLIATAPGYLPDRQQHDLRPAPDGTPTPVEFQLAKQRPPRNQVQNRVRAEFVPTPNRDVTGLVVGLDRKPVAASVFYGNGRARGVAEAKTDAAGRFRLAGVPDQPWTISVIPDRPDLAPEIAEVDGGGDQDVLIVTPPGRTATGVVHDDRRAPFAGVKVDPWVAATNLHLAARAATTDAAGRFAITGLPDSPTNLNFTGDRLVRATVNDARLDSENDVTMTALGVLAGRVVDADGRPVRTFRVVIGSPRKPPAGVNFGQADLGGAGLTFAADDGTFRVRDQIPNSVARITILAPGYAAATIDPVTAVPSNQFDPAAVPVFRLGPPHTLRIHTVAAGKRTPVADARVMLIGAPIGPGDFQWSSQGYAWYDTARARSDARGVATFDPLAYDEAIVLVEAPGFGRRHVAWTDGAADLEVPLEPEATIEGAILDEATGRGLDGIFIMLNSVQNGQLDITPKAGDGGRFRFGELPEGTYQFTVETAFGTLHQEQIVLKSGEHAPRTLRLKMLPAVAPFGEPFPPNPPALAPIPAAPLTPPPLPG